ncbi:MAG: hypothetical protein JNG84_07585 [Archangium sp.]|nr:hypothetical protein [Archangium sp.]
MKALCALTAVLAASAWGWPADWVHDVPAAREKFVKLPTLDWVEVDAPSTVQAEWLADSNELLLTAGAKPGRALMLLGAEGKVALWRVRVGGAPPASDAALAAAKKACPGLLLTPSAEVKLTVTVKTDVCRAALLTLFQTEAFAARELELTFDAPMLRAQLKGLQTAFDAIAPARVMAKYVGAGLVLEGAVSAAEHRKLLWAVALNSLGRVALDDHLVVEQPPDAGSP